MNCMMIPNDRYRSLIHRCFLWNYLGFFLGIGLACSVLYNIDQALYSYKIKNFLLIHVNCGSALWLPIINSLVLLILGSSYVGFVFVPILVCLRGFCISAASVVAYGESIECLMQYAIPTLLSTIAFLQLSDLSFHHSCNLLHYGASTVSFRELCGHRLFCAVVLLILSAVIQQLMISF